MQILFWFVVIFIVCVCIVATMINLCKDVGDKEEDRHGI
jgi:hypothetical protein